MARKTKTKRRPRPEVLWSYVRVQKTTLSVSCTSVSVSSMRNMSWIEFLGEMTVPVRGIGAISLSVSFDGDLDSITVQKDPRPVGTLLRIRQPQLEAVVGLPLVQFDRLWILAVAERIRSFHLSFDAPYRGSSLIRGVSFYTELPEEDQSSRTNQDEARR